MVHTQSLAATYPLNAARLQSSLNGEKARCPQLDETSLNLPIRAGTFMMKDVTDESWTELQFACQAPDDAGIANKPASLFDPYLILCSWQRVIFVHAPKVYVHWCQEARHKST